VISQNFICRHIYNKNKKSYFYPNFTVMENITAMKSRKRPKSSAVGQIKNFFFRKEALERHWRRKFLFFFPKSISTIVKNIFTEGNVWKNFFKVKKIKKLKKKRRFSLDFHFSKGFGHFLWQKKFWGSFWRLYTYNPTIKAQMLPPSTPPPYLAVSPSFEQC
jgi:hypothetical protein